MSRRRIHFIGVGGSGMSSIAAVLAARGVQVSGSDRDHDRGGNLPLFDWLASRGIELLPQDGRGVHPPGVEVVASGAVEGTVGELQAARQAGRVVLHRSDLLAELVHGGRGVAVGGTSGKSTVTAMTAWVLRDAGWDPTFIGGASLVPGAGEGAWPGPGAWNGAGAPVVVEADESDGSLVRYRPEVGIVTNLTEDHRPLPDLQAMFEQFAAAASGALIVHHDQAAVRDLAPARGVPRVRFGFEPGADPRAVDLDLRRDVSVFRVGSHTFRLRLPGRFNVENALAALAAARCFGVDDPTAAESLARFPGLSRRMERVGAARGVEVIDDFAHNPDKVASALRALRIGEGRLLVAFRLHGFGPARMHRRGLVEAFASELRPGDRLWMLPIYFAGGTVTRDITAGDYVDDLRRAGVDARESGDVDDLPARLAAEASPGDRIVILGARDPSLPLLARRTLAALHPASQGDVMR